MAKKPKETKFKRGRNMNEHDPQAMRGELPFKSDGGKVRHGKKNN